MRERCMQPFMRFLLITIIFASCVNSTNSPLSNPKISTEKLDTIKTTAFSVTTKPEIFETAFFQGTIAKMDSSEIGFYSVNIGKLNIESGKLIACDPIVMRDAKPFVQNFPIGQFPVQLAVAK